MLEKTFRPQEVEQKHYKDWEDSGSFASGRKTTADPYTIVIPPPNVTGSLHMGHALNSTLQDVLIRYQRMQGKVRRGNRVTELRSTLANLYL